jgi:DNA-binding beta-propeller fold protein YncE
VIGLLLAAIPTPATAFSSHAFATSIAGSGPSALTNPTDVAVDPTTGDIFVANTVENARQTVLLDATGGTYSLSFRGQTTAPIDYDLGELSYQAVQSALEGLSTVGPGNVRVFNLFETGFRILFQGKLGDAEQPQLTADASGLTGASSTVDVSTIFAGSSASEIEKFSPSGQFILMVGAGVNKTASEAIEAEEAQGKTPTADELRAANRCTAAEQCQPGSAGSAPAAFDGYYHQAGYEGTPGPEEGTAVGIGRHRLYLGSDPSTGGLYVADPGTGLVTKFDSEGNLLTGWGNGGQLDGSTASAGGPFRPYGKLGSEQNQTIEGVEVLSDGTLSVEGAHSVFRFAPDGSFLTVTPVEGLEGPGLTVIDPLTRDLYRVEKPPAGKIYGSRQSAVSHYAPSGLLSHTFGADDLSQPGGFALNSATDTIYVADAAEQRVAVFAPLPYLPDPFPQAVADTPQSEKLGGEVDPAGAGPITACAFQYATETAYRAHLVDEVQSLSLAGATGGTFTLTFKGQTTAPISFDANSRDVEAALQGLSKVGSAPNTQSDFRAGDVLVNGFNGGPYTIEFTNGLLHPGQGLGHANLAQITADPSALAPSGATATVETEVEGDDGYGSAPATECSPHSLPYSEHEPTQVSAAATGLEYGTAYRFHLVLANASGENASVNQAFTTLPLAPQIESQTGQAFAETALIHASINPGGGPTTYKVEFVTQEQFESEGGFEHAQSSPELQAGSAKTPQQLTARLTGLTPATTYRYRVLAANASSLPGGTPGPARSFTTLPFLKEPAEACPNAHVRQQTSSAQLLDCRAYELVSAADPAGYDVESNLVPGQVPFAGYPEAPDRVLYGVHNGGIPGTDHPTNRGIDPYVATRGSHGWSTEYVGVPADNPFAAGPFSSTPSGAAASLETFAFGAPGGCSPCFAGGYTGIPVHRPDGALIQGMAGPSDPGASAKADGYIAKGLSADGQHLLFGSTSLFAPGGNDSTGDVSIYDHNLATGETHVVSNAPGGQGSPVPLACLQGAGKCNSAEGDANGIAELDISADGSHILLGQKVATGPGENVYWHLYMNVGDSISTVDLTPGTTHGVLFDGMTSDGSKVFFATRDALSTAADPDGDASVDIYRADVSASTAALTRVSAGLEGTGNANSCDPVANSARVHWNTAGAEANCDAVAISGGGGVASGEGSIYFLSPELLDGPSNGVEDAPNLYLARPGSAARFITTLESVLTGPQPPKRGRLSVHDFGSFEKATGLAVDHSTGDVYVLDATANKVTKFNSSGNPVTAFGDASPSHDGTLSGLATPEGSFESAEVGPSQLAVDNDPTSPSYRDLYVADALHGVVDKFDSSGQYEGQLPVPLPLGVAVNQANGHVYVTSFFGHAWVFDADGNPAAPTSFPIPSFTASAIAVDSSGTAYVANAGGTTVYDSSGTEVGTLDDNPSHGVAVDPASGEVYVDEGPQIAQFDSSANQLGAVGSGFLSDSVGVAVDPAGDLYATNASGTKVADFGPVVLLPSPSIDNPAVLDAVGDPGARHSADFQVSPSGDFAAFPSSLALAGNEEDTAGHAVLYRYAATAQALTCVSCTTSGFPSAGDSSLADDGLSLTDDGRVFFNSTDPLVAADTDKKQDVFEWEFDGEGNCQSASPAFSADACLALVSAGTSPFASGLLSAGANGNDAYFFTRDSLAAQDKIGPTMKIYDAREGGGFPYEFPPVTCKASDECHGAASPAPGPIDVGSGTLTSPQPLLKCKKGFVRKHEKCVRKSKGQKHHKKKRAGHGHGGRR